MCRLPQPGKGAADILMALLMRALTCASVCWGLWWATVGSKVGCGVPFEAVRNDGGDGVI